MPADRTRAGRDRADRPELGLVACEDVAELLPGAVDLDDDARRDRALVEHLDSCLRCQAELVRYRRMLRGLRLLRTQLFEPAPGALARTLAGLTAATERRVHPVLSARRLVLAGAVGGALAAGATTMVVLAQRSRRRVLAG